MIVEFLLNDTHLTYFYPMDNLFNNLMKISYALRQLPSITFVITMSWIICHFLPSLFFSPLLLYYLGTTLLVNYNLIIFLNKTIAIVSLSSRLKMENPTNVVLLSSSRLKVDPFDSTREVSIENG